MRKAVKWLAGAVGLAALARLRSQRPVPVGQAPLDDPAEELRRRLAEGRDTPFTGTAVETVEDDTAENETETEAESDPAEIDRRRAEVHARAHEAIESMREGEPGPDSSGGADPAA